MKKASFVLSFASPCSWTVLASIFEKTVGYVLSERKQFGKKLDVYHYIEGIVS